MGALHPSLDPALVRLLRQSLPLDRLIESLAPDQPSAASAVAFTQVYPARALVQAAEAGDVIVTGTPGGVGAKRTPPVWMKAGDTIDISIQGVGVLSNPVTA